MNRRNFVLATSMLPLALNAQEKNKNYTVAVIGHTGRGGYGHSLDIVWRNFSNIKITAVADPVETGLAKAKARLKADKAYSDYRKMLAEVKPDLVAICPRHPDQHFEMMKSAIEIKAKGIYIEKPFCRSPKEADLILQMAKEANCKIAVAHRNRYLPVISKIKELIDKGEIGKVLEVRGRGKGDHRGGCVDLWVLGSHVLNLINYFCGKAQSCSSIILRDGKSAPLTELRDGEEGLGKILGNEVHARFHMENGCIAYFDSMAKDDTKSQGFGLEIIGSKGVIQIQCDRNPLASIIQGNPYKFSSRTQKVISSAGIDQVEPKADNHKKVFDHIIPVRDLLSSIEENRAPLCDAEQAAHTVEMICAVLQSHKEGGKTVKLPMQNREHPFGL